MTGKAARRKGHNFEREIARELREVGFPDAERLLESQVSQANGIDLRNTGPFDIQCKCRKTYVPIETIKEIDGDGWPLLVTKKSGQRDPMAVLPWSVLKHLIASYVRLNGRCDGKTGRECEETALTSTIGKEV